MASFIVPTFSARHIAAKIRSKTKKWEVILPAKNKQGRRHFPDGELYIRINSGKNLKNKRVVVLHSGIPQPNEGLVELEFLLEALKERGAKSEVFFSYFPYSRQDKIFEEGETNIAENILRKLANYHQVKKIYVIDPHFGKRSWLKLYPVKTITSLPLLKKAAQQDFGEKIFFVSPDQGGERRTGIAGMRKKRLPGAKIKIYLPAKINLANKTVGVVDDLIQGGNTLLEAYKILKKAGAKKILALASHGVMPAGIRKVKKQYSKLYLANTIDNKEANIDITDLILSSL